MVCIAVAAAPALLSGSALAGGRGWDRIVSFGASLSDTGNAFVFLSDPAHHGCGVPPSVPPCDMLDDDKVPDGPYATGGPKASNDATGGDYTKVISDALTSLAVSIHTLRGLGARHFLLMNVPDVGKTPAIRQLAAQLRFPPLLGYATALSAACNGGLQGVAGAYAAVADIRILDAFGKLNAIVADPAAYGLANVTNACVMPGVPPFKCQKPETYLFWDGIHPTRVVHEVLAQEAIGRLSAAP